MRAGGLGCTRVIANHNSVTAGLSYGSQTPLGYLQFTRPLRRGVLFVVDSSSFVYSRLRATIRRNAGFRHTTVLSLSISLSFFSPSRHRAHKSFASNFRRFAARCPHRRRPRRISITTVIATNCAYFRVGCYLRETVSAGRGDDKTADISVENCARALRPPPISNCSRDPRVSIFINARTRGKVLCSLAI